MLKFWVKVKTGLYPNASTFAMEYECSTKSVHRDIEFLRDRLGFPIRYNKTLNGYEVDGDIHVPEWLKEVIKV